MSIPIWADSFVVGLAANILALVIGSRLTKLTEEEKLERTKLFVVPPGELVPSEIKKTKRTVAFYIGFGVLVSVALLLLWVVPYYSAL